MGSVLDRLGEGLAAVAAAELADDESILALVRLRARLDAITCVAVARWDALGRWRVTTARDATAWLTTRCRVSKAEARGPGPTGRRRGPR